MQPWKAPATLFALQSPLSLIAQFWRQRCRGDSSGKKELELGPAGSWSMKKRQHQKKAHELRDPTQFSQNQHSHLPERSQAAKGSCIADGLYQQFEHVPKVSGFRHYKADAQQCQERFSIGAEVDSFHEESCQDVLGGNLQILDACGSCILPLFMDCKSSPLRSEPASAQGECDLLENRSCRTKRSVASAHVPDHGSRPHAMQMSGFRIFGERPRVSLTLKVYENILSLSLFLSLSLSLSLSIGAGRNDPALQRFGIPDTPRAQRGHRVESFCSTWRFKGT